MEYDKQRLCDLRDYAREIGVKAPTTYTKAQLIERIRAIVNGKEKPYFTKKQAEKRRIKEIVFVLNRIKEKK